MLRLSDHLRSAPVPEASKWNELKTDIIRVSLNQGCGLGNSLHIKTALCIRKDEHE